MNKHLRRFLVLVVGCSLVMGSATFAADNKANTTTGTAKTETEMDFDGEWDDFDDDFEGEDCDFELPETGAEAVKELKEYYNLTSAEEAKLIKLYDEVLKIEKNLDFDKMTDKDWEELEKKTDSIWEQIDEVLLKYDKAELLKEEIPALDKFIEEHDVDKSKLSTDELAKIQDHYNKIVAAKKAGDADKLYAAYDALYNWADTNLNDTVFFEMDDVDFDEEDFDGDFEDDYDDNMTDEEFEKMMMEEIKTFDVDAFIKELPVTIAKDDIAKIKSIHADMVKAADKNNAEEIYKLYDAFDKVMEKYDDAIEKHYEEEMNKTN